FLTCRFASLNQDWQVRNLPPHLGAWPAYMAVVLGIAAPWFIAMAAIEPNFLEYFFWKHNVERFATPFDHTKPVWFYLPELAVGLLPLLVLLPAMAWFAWRAGSVSNRSELRTKPNLTPVANAPGSPQVLRFLL